MGNIVYIMSRFGYPVTPAHP